MEYRFQKLEEKLDTLNEKLSALTESTIENTSNLREHMRRTLANEEQNALLREYIDLQKKELEAKIEPALKFVDRAKFLGLVLGVMGTVVLGLDKLGLFKFLFGIH